jgi:hypothetical protein
VKGEKGVHTSGEPAKANCTLSIAVLEEFVVDEGGIELLDTLRRVGRRDEAGEERGIVCLPFVGMREHDMRGIIRRRGGWQGELLERHLLHPEHDVCTPEVICDVCTGLTHSP